MKCPSCFITLVVDNTSNWRCEVCDKPYFSICKNCFYEKLKRNVESDDFGKLYNGTYETHLQDNHEQIDIK